MLVNNILPVRMNLLKKLQVLPVKSLQKGLP
jgi:hypothetical protein